MPKTTIAKRTRTKPTRPEITDPTTPAEPGPSSTGGAVADPPTSTPTPTAPATADSEPTWPVAAWPVTRPAAEEVLREVIAVAKAVRAEFRDDQLVVVVPIVDLKSALDTLEVRRKLWRDVLLDSVARAEAAGVHLRLAGHAINTTSPYTVADELGDGRVRLTAEPVNGALVQAFEMEAWDRMREVWPTAGRQDQDIDDHPGASTAPGTVANRVTVEKAKACAERHVKASGWPGSRRHLRDLCKCSFPTITKVIAQSKILQEAEARFIGENQPRKPTVPHGPQHNVMVDETLRALIECADEADRGKLNTPEMRDNLRKKSPEDLNALLDQARQSARERSRAHN